MGASVGGTSTYDDVICFVEGLFMDVAADLDVANLQFKALPPR